MRFQRLCYIIYYQKVNIKNRGLGLKNILYTQCLWGYGFHAKSALFLNIFSGDMHFMFFRFMTLLDLFKYWSHSWRKLT